jgi:hypothetical protein
MPDWDAFDCLVRIEAGESVAPSRSLSRPCALVREGDGWRLIEAATVARLHDRVRCTLAKDWTWPLGLRREGDGG